MADPRTCTCHPGDNPPVPCARQYALDACRSTHEAVENLRRYATDNEFNQFTWDDAFTCIELIDQLLNTTQTQGEAK